MSREWKPGDVAMVRNEYDVWNLAVCAVKAGVNGFVWQYGVADSWAPITADARPLVVIDPEDREQVEQLAAACRTAFGWTCGPTENDTTATQAALRSLVTPPKPPEPQGLGAVVEDAEGRRWVRGEHAWTNLGAKGIFLNWTAYADLAAVKVLSEGVTP